MIQLRTNKEVTIPTERGTKQGIVHLIIDRIELDNNNIKAMGYYYHIEENGTIKKLSSFGNNSMVQWETLNYLEANLLQPFQSETHLKDNILQRLKEATLLQIDKEAYENYGTIAEDWVDDINVSE